MTLPGCPPRPRYLFGPVASRRLGRSLGVDLLPYKTCSLDCLYCECGATTELTTRRQAWVPTDQVLAELDEALSAAPELDYVTFSGSGEPTLHEDLGRIVLHIKERYPAYRVAVLSNGTLFTEESVRRSVARVDLLVPSLDGATESAFRTLNRPQPALRVDAIIDGLVALRDEFAGTFALECFIAPGVNDGEEDLQALERAARRIRPDLIQLNRLDRAGTSDEVAQASDEQLARIARALAPIPIAIACRRSAGVERRAGDRALRAAILAQVAQAPCDARALSFVLGHPEGLVAKHVTQLLADGELVRAPGSAGPHARDFVAHARLGLDGAPTE